MNKDITLEDLGYETTSEKIEKELIIQIENKLKKNKFVPKANLEYLIKHLQIDINELQEQTEMLKMTPNGNYINTVETQIAVLIEENRKLQHQLGEKDKIIDEILNHPFFTNECPYSSIGDGFVQELCDCDNCQEDYKKCWIKYFKNEILGRGKNVNSK